VEKGENLRFDKFVGNKFEHHTVMARRAEGRKPGVILVRQPSSKII